MASAQGIDTVVAIKKQSAFATAASGSGGQQLRRTEMTIDLAKATYESAEKVNHAQIVDYRHGVRSVPGTLNGELSPGSYNLPLQSVLRRDFVAGVSTTALTTIAAVAQTGGNAAKLTRSSGSFITDGFKIGDVVRASGFASPATANNARNLRITALDATNMSVGTATSSAAGMPEALVARAAGDTVTVAVQGKKTYAPLTSLTSDWYTIEKWFSDIAQSEVYSDIKFGGATINLPATGMATISMPVLGRQMTTGTSQVLTSPAAASTTGILAAVNGLLRVNGTDVAIVTGLTIEIANGVAGSDPAVGSNLLPSISVGRTRVTGQITAAFEDGSLRDLFVNETEFAIHVTLVTSNDPNAEFLSIYLGRCKLGGAAKTDPDTSPIQTFPFVALLNNGSGTSTVLDSTTIAIQDSTL